MTPRVQTARWALNSAVESWINCQCGACRSQDPQTISACRRFLRVKSKVSRVEKLMTGRSNS